MAIGKLYDLEAHLLENVKLYAHTRGDEKKKETLKEHLKTSLYYFKKINREKKLVGIWETFAQKFDVNQEAFIELLEHTIYLHDLGKVNVEYQKVKMDNPVISYKSIHDTKHALLSALLYIDYFFDQAKTHSMQKDYAYVYIMLLNAYVISRHHTTLENFYDLEKNLIEIIEKLEDPLYAHILSCYKKEVTLKVKQVKNLFKMARLYEENHLSQQTLKAVPYVYSRLVHSTLVACDFYATTEYMEDEKIKEIGLLKTPNVWMKAYKEHSVYPFIKAYKNKRRKNVMGLKEMNDLRSEMFLEAEENLKVHSKEHLFYLEAPTGSGKTNTSIYLALKLLKEDTRLNKLFYIFPFNTLAEQTYKSLEKCFGPQKELMSQIRMINCMTPIKPLKVDNEVKKDTEEKIEDLDVKTCSKMILDNDFLHDGIILTSHVRFFNLLFGTSREEMGGLYQLANSVVILDEMQSYKNTLWKEIIMFLESYGSLLNIKIIMMSATLPKMGELIQNSSIPTLTPHREKYFEHPLFKNRVKLDFSLLKEKNVKEALYQKVIEVSQNNEKNILIEFIQKKAAVAFYNEMKALEEESILPKKVYLLTGDDNKWEREELIEKVKHEKNILLIATQLIEAGVDIDMDIGFKDSSLLDAEEQFLGRINRSCLKPDAIAYFFNLVEARTIYRGDYRKNEIYTILQEDIQEILETKAFDVYYKKIIKEIETYNQSQTEMNYEIFENDMLKPLKYAQIKERMKLIDDELYPVTVFLAREITIKKDGKENHISGSEVWKKYKELITTSQLEYSKRKVELSNLQEQVSFFVWQVKDYQQSYNDRLGSIYYIEDGEQYFTNGKFDREKLTESSFELI